MVSFTNQSIEAHKNLMKTQGHSFWIKLWPLRGYYIVLVTRVFLSDSRIISTHNPLKKKKVQHVKIPWFLYMECMKMNEVTFWNKTIERSLLWYFASGLLVLYSNIHYVDSFCDFRQVALLLLTFLNLAIALSNKTAMKNRCCIPLAFTDI